MGWALLAATALAGDFGYDYWTTGRFMQSTDDAYVQADYTTVAPKVSGYIADVLVQDNEPVKAGQVLAHIDDRDFRAAQAQAKASEESAEAAIRNIDAEMALQQSVIEQARAQIGASQASLKFNRSDVVRYNDLARNGYASEQRAQQSETARSQSGAEVERDQAALAAAQKKVAVLDTQRLQAVAERDRTQAALHQADLNLSYTTITAPVDGTVGARSLRVGEYVAAGTQLMAVVPLNAAYIVANFKETQLTRVRDGQPVTVKVDSFPERQDAPAMSKACRRRAGWNSPLLPPDNATMAPSPRSFSTYPGEDRVLGRCTPRQPAARRHVGRADRQHQGAGRSRRLPAAKSRDYKAEPDNPSIISTKLSRTGRERIFRPVRYREFSAMSAIDSQQINQLGKATAAPTGSGAGRRRECGSPSSVQRWGPSWRCWTSRSSMLPCLISRVRSARASTMAAGFRRLIWSARSS